MNFKLKQSLHQRFNYCNLRACKERDPDKIERKGWGQRETEISTSPMNSILSRSPLLKEEHISGGQRVNSSFSEFLHDNVSKSYMKKILIGEKILSGCR